MPRRKMYLPVLCLLSAGLACAQTGVIGTYAGIGSAGLSGDGGLATSAMLNGPVGLALDISGNLFVADSNNSRIRKVSGGIITTVAGGGAGGDGGLATAAQLQNPCDVKVDSAGNLYISESCVVASGGSGAGVPVMSRIRRVDASTGIITTIAGGNNWGFSGDGGPATSALLNAPAGLAIDGSGNIYVADSGNNRVRRIDGLTGVITTVAGTGVASFGGDGGPAIAASFNNPSAVALDSTGNLYVADGGNSRIRRVDGQTGIVSTMAGSGSTSYNGDGILATNANVGFATALQVNAAGNLLLTDLLNNRVRLVDASTGLIWTIAGDGTVPLACCQAGDGRPATLAPVNAPGGVAFSPTGPLFVAEHRGQRVRQIALQNPLVSSAVNATASSASSASVPYGSPLTLTALLSVMTGSPANVTGNVQFVDAAGPFGYAAVVNGSSSLTTSSLQMGAHSITAQYFGDSVFGASTSVPVSVTITAPQSSVALGAYPSSPAIAGQPVMLTATVTPSTATGTVNFFNGSVSLGMANIGNGTATLTGVNFTAGSYSLTAQYSGNINLPASTSPAITLKVKASTSIVLTSSVNPSNPGQALTFTATVSPSTASGTFQFFDSGSPIGSVSTMSGPATLSISTLSSGPHSISASYSGDATNASATSAALVQTVLSSSSAVVTSSQNPAPVGGPVTFTVAVSPGTAGGTVQLVDGSTVLSTGTLVAGSASFIISTLVQGTHAITAVYGGDASNAGSTSAVVSQSVKATAALVLASSLNPSTVGQTVTFTASCNPAATGTMQFLDGGTVLATVPVSSGGAAFSTSALVQGPHSIAITYSGDTNYLSAQSATLTQTVNLIATTTTLTSTQNPAFAGGAVSFIANVTPATVTGTVQFLDGATAFGTGNLSNGSASFTTSALTQGTHSITAVYGGDTSDAGSVSAVVSQSMKVSAGMTTGLNPSPGVTGQNVTVTANLNAAATGTVTFTDGGTVLATVQVGAGIASYSTTSLTQGTHTLGINYSGDSTYMSQSVTFPETILGATTIAVASNANPASTGQSVTFTSTVTPSAATGNVQFYDGQTLIVTVALSGGSASYATSALTVGTHSITANYIGSATYAPSYSSNTLPEVVKTSTSVTLTSTWNPSLVGGAVTFNAVVSPSTATGPVQFLDGSTLLGSGTLLNGSASFTTPALTQGAHSITAVYGGDAADAGATSAVLPQSVKLLAGMTPGVSPSRPVAGQPVTMSATLAAPATGTVTFLDGSTVLATVTVVSAAASYTTSSLAAGVHALTINYSGDTTYMSSGTTFSQTILAVASIGLGSNVSPSGAGQNVTFTAVVTPSAATGTVQFMDRGTVLATSTIASGIAVFSTSSLAVGAHSIVASYSGDANVAPASSAAVVQTVKSIAVVLLTSSANPSTVGQGVTFTASVMPATSTGTVEFRDGSIVIATVAVTSGAAAFSTSQLPQGPHSISALYAGDANDTAATSAILAQAVNIAAPASPSNLAATAAGPTQINLTWAASLTAGVTYNVYSSMASGFTPSASNRIATGVIATSYATTVPTSSTHYFRVTAVNAGLESAATNQASATTAASLSCHVGYSVTNQWNVGFQAALSIKNTGSTSVNSWTMTWTWPGNQVIAQAWNSNFTQKDENAKLTNANWNSTIAPGATVTGVGFIASYSGSNHVPTAFYVNGTLCH